MHTITDLAGLSGRKRKSCRLILSSLVDKINMTWKFMRKMDFGFDHRAAVLQFPFKLCLRQLDILVDVNCCAAAPLEF